MTAKLTLHETVESQLETQVVKVEEERLALQARHATADATPDPPASPWHTSPPGNTRPQLPSCTWHLAPATSHLLAGAAR